MLRQTEVAREEEIGLPSSRAAVPPLAVALRVAAHLSNRVLAPGRVPARPEVTPEQVGRGAERPRASDQRRSLVWAVVVKGADPVPRVCRIEWPVALAAATAKT